MIVARVKKNIGFLLAGAVLAGVAFNVWYEFNSTEEGSVPCQCTSTH